MHDGFNVRKWSNKILYGLTHIRLFCKFIFHYDTSISDNVWIYYAAFRQAVSETSPAPFGPGDWWARFLSSFLSGHFTSVIMNESSRAVIFFNLFPHIKKIQPATSLLQQAQRTISRSLLQFVWASQGPKGFGVICNKAFVDNISPEP